jgi:hypothetical protein
MLRTDLVACALQAIEQRDIVLNGKFYAKNSNRSANLVASIKNGRLNVSVQTAIRADNNTDLRLPTNSKSMVGIILEKST